MGLTKKQQQLLEQLTERQQTIEQHFNQWITWKEVCEVVGWEYSSAGNVQKRQQEQLAVFVDYQDNNEARQNKRYMLLGFLRTFFEESVSLSYPTFKYLNDQQNGENVRSVEIGDNVYTEQEILTSLEMLEKLDNAALRVIFARNIVDELFKHMQKIQDGETTRTDRSSKAWYVTNLELGNIAGMIGNAYYEIARHPRSFCMFHEIPMEHIDIVKDHTKVDDQWFNQQRNRTLKYLANTLHLVTYDPSAYILKMATTRKIDMSRGVVEVFDYCPTLDELEWIKHTAIPVCLSEHYVNPPKEIPFSSVKQVYYAGHIDEFYKDWLPNVINRLAPVHFGWAHIYSVQKCNRIGFNFSVLELALQNGKLDLSEEDLKVKQRLQQIQQQQAQEATIIARNKETKKRHKEALDVEIQHRTVVEITRAKQEYVEIGFIVNTEIHNSRSKYTKWRAIKKADELKKQNSTEKDQQVDWQLEKELEEMLEDNKHAQQKLVTKLT